MKKGFTLIELLVVITILAILATGAWTSFKGYNENGGYADAQAQQDRCIMNNFDAIRKDSLECKEVFDSYKCEDMILTKYKCDFKSLKEGNVRNY